MTAKKGKWAAFWAGIGGGESGVYNGRIHVERLKRRIFTTEGTEFHGGIRGNTGNTDFGGGISSLICG